MKSKISLRTTRWLLAIGLAFGAAAAQAALGVAVTKTQQTAVKVGMSAAEVQLILGRPAQIFNFRSEAGLSWTYYLVGTPYGTTEFDVDFDSDGRVVAAREFARPSGG